MAQTERDSRWITIREAYNHYWPSRAVTHYLPGEYLVKNAVADGAIAKGKASEGKADGSSGTPPKKRNAAKKRATSAAGSAKKTANAKAADTGPASSVGVEDVPAAGGPADGPAVDSNSG